MIKLKRRSVRVLLRRGDTMIIVVSEEVLCYGRMVSVSLPINVRKRILESPVSSEFESNIILHDNRSKMIHSNTRSNFNFIRIRLIL